MKLKKSPRLATSRVAAYLAVSAIQLTTLAAAEPAVHSQAGVDSFVFTAAEPYGVAVYGGLPDGASLTSAQTTVVNPSFDDYGGQFLWTVPGTYSASAQTAAGLNRAAARAEGAQPVLEGSSQVLVTGMSTWTEGITIVGGSGTATLTLTARVDGDFRISGAANSEGRVGIAGAAFNVLTTNQMTPATVTNPVLQGLAFNCASQTDCDYDLRTFNSHGGLELEVTSSQSVDQIVTVNIPFEYNVPFRLIGAFEVGAMAFNAGAVVEADFMNTARITGFVAPPDSTVFVESGAYASFALTSPVPEPAAWVFFSAGALLVFVGRRQKKAVLKDTAAFSHFD